MKPSQGLLAASWAREYPSICVAYERVPKPHDDAFVETILRIEAFAGGDGIARDKLRNCLASKRSDTVGLYFARVMDMRVGYALTLTIGYSTWIRRVAVKRGSQRRGLGRGLVESIRRDLRPEHPELMAVVNEANVPAQLFFARCGFDGRYLDNPNGPRETILFTARERECAGIDPPSGDA